MRNYICDCPADSVTCKGPMMCVNIRLVPAFPSGDSRRLTEAEYREMNDIARYSASFPIRSLPATYRLGGSKYERYQELDRKLFDRAT